MMDSLRDRIATALVQNEHKQRFVPYLTLVGILSDEMVEECIRQSPIETHLKNDCIIKVKSGGRKILFILIRIGRVDLLAKLVEWDRAQQDTHLDSQLPFEEISLQKILGSYGAAIDFYDHQWATIPPFFAEDRTHRIYDKRTILPFMSPTKPLGGGAFGEVSIMTLAGSQHGFRDLQRRKV